MRHALYWDPVIHYKRSKQYFENRVNKDGPVVPYVGTPCWLWTGFVRKKYGKTHSLPPKRGESEAHRVSYELYNGKIPQTMCVLHKCDVPICVNPVHLFLGTLADNCKDRDQKGRHRSGNRLGETHPNHILTSDQVIEIRERKYCINDLADIYGVSRETIEGIIYNRSWKHLLTP